MKRLLAALIVIALVEGLALMIPVAYEMIIGCEWGKKMIVLSTVPGVGRDRLQMVTRVCQDW